MDELLKTLLLTYIFVAIFVGICMFSVVCGCIRMTDKIENNQIKYLLRIVICGALISLWVYYFIFQNVYPLSVAYYECRNGIVEERTGILDGINRREKDRIEVIIDGEFYMMVYSSQESDTQITKGLDKGSLVCFSYGEHSMYIFSISRSSTGDGSVCYRPKIF